jgi:hypothetical protein
MEGTTNEYVSHFLNYIIRAKPIVISGDNMSYTQANENIILHAPTYNIIEPSLPCLPTTSTLIAREDILWGDKDPSHSKINAYTKGYGDWKMNVELSNDNDDVIYKLQQKRSNDILDKKALINAFKAQQKQRYSDAKKIADPVQRQKVLYEYINDAVTFDVHAKNADLRMVEKMEFLPMFNKTEAGYTTKRDRKTAEKNTKKTKTKIVPAFQSYKYISTNDDLKQGIHDPMYMDTPHPVIMQPLFVSSVVTKKKGWAKKQWAMDSLSSCGFSFKTPEECSSRKRLAKHYLSKEDILRALDNHPNITEELPPHYKSVTKDELCGLIFRAQNE